MKLDKKSRIKLIVILITSTVLVFGTGITYSLFTSDTQGILDQKIAKFVFDAKKTDLIELPVNDLYPGQSIDYTFQVANTMESKKSEVTISYQMIIKTYHFMPLDIKLYKIVDGKEEPILTCDESFSWNENNELLCNTATQRMEHSQEILDDYKLKITFPEQYNSEEYSELVDYIDLEIKSWQTIGE